MRAFKSLMLGLLLLGSIQGRAATFALAGLTIKDTDLMTTPKKGYVHVMLDLFAQRSILASRGPAGKPQAMAEALVSEVLAPKFPKDKLFKIMLVEFPERDNYDAPRWDKINVLGRFEARRKGKAFKVVLTSDK